MGFYRAVPLSGLSMVNHPGMVGSTHDAHGRHPIPPKTLTEPCQYAEDIVRAQTSGSEFGLLCSCRGISCCG